MKLPAPSLARIDDAVIRARVADTLQAAIADLEWQADRHYLRCQRCRIDREPCADWDWFWTQISDITRRLRDVND